MKSLQTLLKIAQRKLDELGIEAAKLTQELAELEGRVASIHASEQAEIASAVGDPMFASMLPAYRQRIKLQVAELRARMKVKEDALEDLRSRLSEAYIEKSKFEQLIEQGRIREVAERAAAEQAQLDEVAINRAGGQDR